MVVKVMFKNKLPVLEGEIEQRCHRLKTFGVELHKVEVGLDPHRAGLQAQVNITGRGFRLNASERRFLHPAQALHHVFQKIERQLAKISSKRSKKRPLLTRHARLIQINSSLEFEPGKRLSRRGTKAA